MKKTAFLYLLFALFLISCAPKQQADLILTNAEVYTMEEVQPWARAIAIKGNKILAVLDNENDIKKYAGKETKIIDLEGLFVVPGFIDAHTHFDGFGCSSGTGFAVAAVHDRCVEFKDAVVVGDGALAGVEQR